MKKIPITFQTTPEENVKIFHRQTADVMISSLQVPRTRDFMNSKNMIEQSCHPAAMMMQPLSTQDHIQGRMDAEVVLVEYGDYECTYCAQVYPMVRAIQQSLGDRLCFVFRNFPMTDLHPRAQRAAEAAEAAGFQGKFWEMRDLLFENQAALTDDDIATYARSLGLNVARLMREVFAGSHAFRVKEDIERGRASDVISTPTYFVNGRRCEGALGLYGLIADALHPAGSVSINRFYETERVTVSR